MSPRMLGKVSPEWCPKCRCAPGPDCPDKGCDTRRAKRIEQRHTVRDIEEAKEDTDG